MMGPPRDHDRPHRRFNGRGAPVTSLYARVPMEPANCGVLVRDDVDSMLHELRSMADGDVVEFRFNV